MTTSTLHFYSRHQILSENILLLQLLWWYSLVCLHVSVYQCWGSKLSCTSALTCDALENKSSALWGITNTKPKPKPTKQKNSSSGLIFDLLNKNFCIVLPRRFLFLLTWSSWKSRFKNHWVRECKSIRKTKAVKNWESVHLRNGGAGGRGRSSFSMEYF